MLYFVLEEFNMPSVLLEYLDLFTSLWSSETETFMRHIKALIIIKICGSVSAEPHDTQVCYLWEPLFTSFQPTVVKKLSGLFLPKLHMLCP